MSAWSDNDCASNVTECDVWCEDVTQSLTAANELISGGHTSALAQSPLSWVLYLPAFRVSVTNVAMSDGWMLSLSIFSRTKRECWESSERLVRDSWKSAERQLSEGRYTWEVTERNITDPSIDGLSDFLSSWSELKICVINISFSNSERGDYVKTHLVRPPGCQR